LKALKSTLALALAIAFAGPAQAETTQISRNEYRVAAGVEFSIGASGSSNYTFNWADSSGLYANVADPTLVLVVGQTYTFRLITTSHPFVITDSSLPVSGSAGSYSRTTTSGTVIDRATLDPIGDFTANPAPSGDTITWTLKAADEGDYFYTCRVLSHLEMTGAIKVIDLTVPTESGSWSEVKGRYGN